MLLEVREEEGRREMEKGAERDGEMGKDGDKRGGWYV